MRASAFYRSELWRAGLWTARAMPRPLLTRLAQGLAAGYHRQNRRRREVVIENLLPAVQFDRKEAEAKARNLFREFGIKLADLWRSEAGLAMPKPAIDPGEWERFEAARSKGRGVLLLTPHLGNWELGAPLLRERGIALQVITQPEPHDSLTRLRRESRARWGIETIVIGENPFAFVEVIRRLEAGAVVALLVDRPHPRTATVVKLFGRKFAASIAAAELARASGCALLPVVIPRCQEGYKVEILPELAYDRAALGTRETRGNLTQEVMKQFEPAIRRYVDQWFHFVPLWKGEER